MRLSCFTRVPQRAAPNRPTIKGNRRLYRVARRNERRTPNAGRFPAARGPFPRQSIAAPQGRAAMRACSTAADGRHGYSAIAAKTPVALIL